MWPFTPSCPVTPEEQAWIEESSDWLVGEFGSEPLRRPPVLPERTFFPADYTADESSIAAVFDRVRQHLGVPADRIVLEYEPEELDPELLATVPLAFESNGAAGHWSRRDGRTVITVRLDQARQPISLVATLAHELAHERLLGEDRIDPERRDGEPLTDLTTIFFGFGIFSANAAFEFSSSPSGWRTSSLGYLTERAYGYALAYWSWSRGEVRPAPWTRHLDTNPRTWMKQGLRYLGERRRG
ncbi:hypothetical protein [Microlunatus parietis]|uniref:Uncharacterized protein n=1 Tax=Microlunatus parietis TaxID=682979 RepID=A0A7Y9LDJ2_9ACTN|nr:hypothetical protein [Microlunatus parietis]NYE72001.1 hypothetical protein [Microlunatus parietis]